MNETMNAADAKVRERNTAARLEELREELPDLDEVYEVEVIERESASLRDRVRIVLSVANVTGPVEDLLDEYNAVVVPGTIEVTASSGLAFEVVLPEGFKPADSREIRTHGDSIVVTLTRESLDLSGFDKGTKTDQHAREDAILLTRHGK